MKRVNLIAITSSVIIAFTCGLYVGSYKVFPFNEIRFIKNIIFKSKNLSEDLILDIEILELKIIDGSTLLLGDSIIKNGPWVDLLDKDNISVRGVDGGQTKDFLSTLSSVSSANPENIILHLGINDILDNVSNDVIKRNLVKILAQLQTTDAKIFFLSIIECVRDDCIKKREDIIDINNFIKNYSLNNKVEFLYLTEIFGGREKFLNNYTNDGVHFNLDGYLVLSEVLNKKIEGFN